MKLANIALLFIYIFSCIFKETRFDISTNPSFFSHGITNGMKLQKKSNEQRQLLARNK